MLHQKRSICQVDADEVGDRAYDVAYNGRVNLRTKTTKRGYCAARCVRTG